MGWCTSRGTKYSEALQTLRRPTDLQPWAQPSQQATHCCKLAYAVAGMLLVSPLEMLWDRLQHIWYCNSVDKPDIGSLVLASLMGS